MFQPQTPLLKKDASINDHIQQMRLSATKSLMERRDVIIVSSVFSDLWFERSRFLHEDATTLSSGRHYGPKRCFTSAGRTTIRPQ